MPSVVLAAVMVFASHTTGAGAVIRHQVVANPTPTNHPLRPVHALEFLRHRKQNLIALVAVFLSACLLPIPPPWTGDLGPHVLIFGDSLVFFAENDAVAGQTLLTDTLAVDHQVSVSAAVGALSAGLARERLVEPEPGADIVVIALGTNDLHPLNAIPPTDVVASVAAAVARYDATCTVVVNVVETGVLPDAPTYNDLLDTLGVVVVDWASAVAEHPEFVATDLIHHEAAGRAAYRDAIATGIEACGIPPLGE